MNNKNKVWIAGIILVLALIYFGANDEMSFYKHRECFVSDELMGCEAEGTAITVDKTDQCVTFMSDNGCQPENCYYYGDAECGVSYSVNDMVDQSCYTDEECVERFEHTGYWCFKDHLSPLDTNSVQIGFCKFEGNHLPKGSVYRIFGLEDFSFDEFAENNKTIFMIIGAIFMVWFLVFIFSEEKPKFILR